MTKDEKCEEALFMTEGLRINRRFTEAGKDAYDKIEWSLS